MALPALRLTLRSWTKPRALVPCSFGRSLSTRPQPSKDFAFAFDIDGVLLRSSTPIPGSRETLAFLKRQHIPFILLTNGGGTTEKKRVEALSEKLSVHLEEKNFVQSHSPFAALADAQHPAQYHKGCVLVVGGEADKCKEAARAYGFQNVITPGDLYHATPELWPFSHQLDRYYGGFAQPISASGLKVDAIFVFNDPLDWGLDIQIILDLLLSHRGIVGTQSALNGDRSLPNNGYLQDGQPPLYFSNPDLLWAAAYHLPRLGQGGFREALEGVWRALTGAELHKTVIGKPSRTTYEFAEARLMDRFGAQGLKTVYMVGDNPESDIRGANEYKSPHGVEWVSILTRTGVYQDAATTRPRYEPVKIADDVRAAVAWAVERSVPGEGLGKEQMYGPKQ